MPWVKLDENFADHPKVERVGPLAAWLHVAALCYCSRHLTDGRIPKAKAVRLADIPNPADHVSALVTEGLWADGGDHYTIHDYLDYQPSREKVLADRGIARRRSAMNADPELRKALKARDGDHCRYCGGTVNWRDRKGPTGATYDHVVPLSCGGDESAENLVVCCRDCNSRKNSRTPEQAGMTLLPVRPNGSVGQVPSRSSPDKSRPPSRPVDSDLSTRPQVTHEDDEISTSSVPDETWDHYAKLKLGQQTGIRNPQPWLAKCRRNARTELEAQAQAWWAMFELDPRRLAQALVDGHAPRNVPRRQETP